MQHLGPDAHRCPNLLCYSSLYDTQNKNEKGEQVLKMAPCVMLFCCCHFRCHDTWKLLGASPDNFWSHVPKVFNVFMFLELSFSQMSLGEESYTESIKVSRYVELSHLTHVLSVR